MICTVAGIGVKKDELTALLAFAKKNKKGGEPSQLAVVQFVLEGDRCLAFSTDGHRAIEGDGESDTAHALGEWIVQREFLDKANKLLEQTQVIRLSFAGRSLNTVIIEDATGNELNTLTCPADASPAQTTFPNVRQMIKIPQHRTRARVFTLNAKFLADLTKMAAAADRGGVDIYPPAAPTDPTFFHSPGDATTSWTAIICAMREPPDEEDGEEETDPGPSLPGFEGFDEPAADPS